MFDEQMFAERLSKLRIAKEKSAREMSHMIGQNDGYINNIENGKALPSMRLFFNICDYLGVTPSEFFDTGTPYPERLAPIISDLKKISADDLTALAAIIRRMTKQ